MNPCDHGPRMSNAAWRGFLRRHPGWIAPERAPCDTGHAAAWVSQHPVATVGAGVGALGLGSVSHGLGWLPAWVPGSGWVPLALYRWAEGGAPRIPAQVVHVPEPSGLTVFVVAILALVAVRAVRS